MLSSNPAERPWTDQLHSPPLWVCLLDKKGKRWISGQTTALDRWLLSLFILSRIPSHSPSENSNWMKGIPPVPKLTGLNLSTCYYLSSFIPEWDSPRFVIYFFPDYKGTREQKTRGDRLMTSTNGRKATAHAARTRTTTGKKDFLSAGWRER